MLLVHGRLLGIDSGDELGEVRLGAISIGTAITASAIIIRVVLVPGVAAVGAGEADRGGCTGAEEREDEDDGDEAGDVGAGGRQIVLGLVAVPVVGVAGHGGVRAQGSPVDLHRVLGQFLLVFAVEGVGVGDDALDERHTGDDGAVGVMLAHVTEGGLDLHAVSGLEDQRLPVIGILELADLAVAGDELVGEAQLARLEPRAVSGVRVGGRCVGDGEHDASVTPVHVQHLVNGVTVAVGPAGLLIPFLDGEPGRHVGRVRGDGVRRPFDPVDGLGELVGHGTAHGDALALDERGPRLLMLGVGRHESKHQLRGAHGDHAALVGGELEEFSAETAGVEVGAGDAFAPLGQGLAVLDEVAGGVDGPLAGELVVPGVERVADGPVGDLRVGAVGRQRGAVEP